MSLHLIVFISLILFHTSAPLARAQVGDDRGCPSDETNIHKGHLLNKHLQKIVKNPESTACDGFFGGDTLPGNCYNKRCCAKTEFLFRGCNVGVFKGKDCLDLVRNGFPKNADGTYAPLSIRLPKVDGAVEYEVNKHGLVVAEFDNHGRRTEIHAHN